MQRLRFLAVLALLAGCATQRAWVYAPTFPRVSAGPRPERMVILPFRDARQNVNRNRILLYLIPLFPFGWADFEVPEGIQMHITSGLWTNYKPTEDYPKALAEELKNAAMFREAYFDFKEGDADLAIQGSILSTKYDGKILSYGLSAYGPLLWFFGAPAATASNQLAIELDCKDLHTGQTLFSRHYDASPYRKISWLYVMANDFNYPTMLAEVYRKFVDDLIQTLPPPKNVPSTR